MVEHSGVAYVELRFHRVGPLAHQEAVSTLAAIPGVEVVYDHTMQLGMFQRQRLLVDEWACRILVYVGGRVNQRAPDRREANERDPYRTLEIGDITYEVPLALRKLIDALEASYDTVHSGWVRFSTRVYERPVLEALAADMRERLGPTASVEVSYDGSLHAKVQGSVAKIHALVAWLRRTGMIDPDQLRVGYS
ncbi:MAG: hypothetical protein KC431_29170 [Myxococcales bacterium]|nr:hypothetical protein [Myxococcales bacterium]